MTRADSGRADATDPGPVLVVAPFRRDAVLVQEMLLKYGIAATACRDAADLAGNLVNGSAALVMSQEALTPQMLGTVAGYLAAQPEWSELPVILLLDRDRQSGNVLADLRASLRTAKLTVLQRPVRTLELATTVQAAVAARARQLQLRDHIAWQQELQRELNHRVKNVLANVMAIYYLTLRQNTSLPDFAASFEGRLVALSSVHSALIASIGPRTLMEIAELVLAPYRSAGRISIEGPAVELAQQSAVTLGLCLHELATNAAKYGALSSPQGRLSLGWSMETVEGRPTIRLTWTEADGPLAEIPSRRGYGTRFIHSALRSLGGSVDLQFLPEGLRCVMLALADRIVAAATEDASAFMSSSDQMS